MKVLENPAEQGKEFDEGRRPKMGSLQNCVLWRQICKTGTQRMGTESLK